MKNNLVKELLAEVAEKLISHLQERKDVKILMNEIIKMMNRNNMSAAQRFHNNFIDTNIIINK